MTSAVTSSTDRGCLLVADISGYTDYLMGSELDHAENVLADLIETVVAALRPTFQLSKLEGDAAFAYAVTDRIEASMLLDTIDACYFAFRSRLRDVDRATTCDCTINHCMHGDDVIIERVLDWRPFRYYTAAYEWPGIGEWPWTYELEPVDGGTRVHIRGEALRGHRALLGAAYRRLKVEPTLERGLGELQRAMAGEMVQV